MITKKILSAGVILFILLLTQSLSYGDNNISHKAIRYFAHRGGWLKSAHNMSNSSETDAIAEIEVSEYTASPATLSESGSASSEESVYIAPAMAEVSFYPLYDKEYFYRTSKTEPIRDFRSYDVKTITPDPSYYGYKPDYYGLTKHTQPIRDFRGYWGTGDGE